MPFNPSDFAWWVWPLFALGAAVVLFIAAFIAASADDDNLHVRGASDRRQGSVSVQSCSITHVRHPTKVRRAEKLLKLLQDGRARARPARSIIRDSGNYRFTNS
jgi:hypothetical protein